MAERTHVLSKESLQKLEDELAYLKLEKRKDIAQKIKEAREQGDLSENAEYDAAKDEQRDIEARIEELENLLKNVEVYDTEEGDARKVTMGCHVKVYDEAEEEEFEFTLVGSTEANSLKQKISNESPLGKAILNHTIGDEVVVDSPSGELQYRILSVEKDN